MNLLQKVCCQSIDVGQISCPPCPTCMHQLQSTIDYAFKLCGSIGLFFSFTEVRFRAKRRHVTYHVYIYCTGYNIKCCTEYDLFNTTYLIFKSSIRKCTISISRSPITMKVLSFLLMLTCVPDYSLLVYG